MSDTITAAENTRTYLKFHVATLETSAVPCINAAREIVALNLRTSKEAMLEASDAFGAALFRNEWEPLAKIIRQSGNAQSPKTTEYTMAVGQILGAANTQILLNAGWSSVGMQLDTVSAAQRALASSFPVPDASRDMNSSLHAAE